MINTLKYSIIYHYSYSNEDDFGPSRRPNGSSSHTQPRPASPFFEQPPAQPQPSQLPVQQQPHDWGYSPRNEREEYEMNKVKNSVQPAPAPAADLTTTAGFFDEVINDYYSLFT